jgi:hypothetical protein
MRVNMRLRRSRSSCRVVLLLALLGLVAVAPSAAAEPPRRGTEGAAEVVRGPYVTATRLGGVVRYDYSSKLPDPKVNVYRGTRLPGDGCAYSGAGSSKATSSAVRVEVEREIRQDLRTCVMVTESAVMSPEEAVQVGFRGNSSPADAITVEEGTGSGPELNHDFHTNFGHRGSLKTYYEEPAQGDTSTVEAHVGWTFDGNCVTNWGTHAFWHWLNDTGWTDVNRWADWPGGCTNRTARVYGLFKNGVFCFTNDTFNEYNTTQYTGWFDGGASWSWNARKWGGCNWLLTFHREAYYLGERVQG